MLLKIVIIWMKLKCYQRTSSNQGKTKKLLLSETIGKVLAMRLSRISVWIWRTSMVLFPELSNCCQWSNRWIWRHIWQEGISYYASWLSLSEFSTALVWSTWTTSFVPIVLVKFIVCFLAPQAPSSATTKSQVNCSLLQSVGFFTCKCCLYVESCMSWSGLHWIWKGNCWLCSALRVDLFQQVA